MILNSHQNQNSKVNELEIKLKMQKIKSEKKLKNMEDLFLNQIEILKNKLFMYEKTNNYTLFSNEKLSNNPEEEEILRCVNLKLK